MGSIKRIEKHRHIDVPEIHAYVPTVLRRDVPTSTFPIPFNARTHQPSTFNRLRIPLADNVVFQKPTSRGF